MKIKIDPAKILNVTVTVLGVAGTLLASKVEANNRKDMKDELKEELLKEITKSNE